VAASANPLLNGNFELEDQGALAWWKPGQFVPLRLPNNAVGSEDLTSRYVWDTASHGQGKGSLRIDYKGFQGGDGKKDAPGAMLASPTNETLVKPETEYKLTWFWKGSGLSEKNTVSVVVFVQSPGEVAAPPAGSKFLQQFAIDLKKDQADWTPATLTFKTPPDAGWMQIRIATRAGEPYKKFSVWVDDLVLAQADGGEMPATPQVPQGWTARGDVQAADALGLPDFALVPPAPPYGNHIQRTMRLLETSTPERRNRVKILFYGQSIIGQNWWKSIVADLTARYPHADIIAENPSIGGFQSDMLKDTMYADCYTANADLICFHDYGTKDAEMEEMFTNMRKLTTAEVVAFTHHFMFQNGWEKGQTKDSELIARMSAGLSFECVDIRTNWKKYMEATKTEAGTFLKDGVHLNMAGEALWLKFALPHFQARSEASPCWRRWVKVYTPDGKPFAADKQEYPSGSTSLAGPVKLSFEGTRVDVIADAVAGQKLGTAKILIDGKAPSAYPELYVATRGSRPPNFFWPMLRRAEVGKDPVAEKWTLMFSKISETGEDFNYEVKGSVTGADGSGNAREKFVSKSGRLIIEPAWFTISPLVKKTMKGKVYPDGTTCTFDIRPNFMDVWKPQSPVPAKEAAGLALTQNGFGPVLSTPVQSGSEQRYTLVSGLTNGPHVLEIIPQDDGELPLRAIVVHEPPKVDAPANASATKAP
jgi:hypothetical protein